MSADRQIASFIAAVERNDLKAARWIYAGLDPQAQRQADLILVGKIAQDQAGLALERGEFMGRLATLMEIHSAETVADLPAHVRDQVNADLIALGLAEEELSANGEKTTRRERVERGIYRNPKTAYEFTVTDSDGKQRWTTIDGNLKAARPARAEVVAKLGKGERAHRRS